MPRKKDPPPSTLLPRRSARGASKSTSLLDGEDAESFVVPLVGFGDTRVGEDSLQPSLLPSGTNLCNINKEISLVPSVTVSLVESEQGLRSINKENFLENSASAGTLLAGKTGLAGSVTGLSDGSTGVRSFSGSRNDTDGVGFAVASPKPPVTPLFSPEFKAMLGREYPRKTVFSPRPMLSGEATEGRGLWDGLPQSRSESFGESISMPVAHGSSPDVGVHVHMPEDGDEHGSAVHSVHAKEGTNLSSGVALDEGVQATTKVWNGMHASAELHGGGDLPMPKPLGVEVVQDVQVHVPGTGQESEFEVKAIEENHSGPVASVEGIHGLHGVYGEVGNEVLHVLNREEGLHVHSNVVHGGLDEVPMQPIEVAKVAPEGRDGINVGLVDDGVGVRPTRPHAHPEAPGPSRRPNGADPVLRTTTRPSALSGQGIRPHEETTDFFPCAMIPSPGGTPPPTFTHGRPPDPGSRVAVEPDIPPSVGVFLPQVPDSAPTRDEASEGGDKAIPPIWRIRVQ
ncbi:hypothetical protein L1987_42310 [Smallanthus sonchifolius]|uniref:Uncharacterized protein n=1 Tax=Smallanthus sonchifolius TaxID=185202 RepID=A0ACB9GHX2_9ASTR|nr:hypothetical protein L1987_42310 [Smallanthus sonchifolius]